MEEDIEKALNNLWNSLDDEFFNLTYSQEQMQEDIRLILNRYNYLDSKNENLINKYKEQGKMIELMAKDIADITGSCPYDLHNYQIEDCENICTEINQFHKEYSCFIDYYEKKAREENEIN